MVLLGIVLALAEGVRQVWVREGLRGVEYRRRLPRPRGIVGEPVPLDVTVWNRKPLPLAWLRATDEMSAGVSVRERTLIERRKGAALANVWTLAPFERVTRHFHVVADRRGVYSLGPVALEAGDLFAREAAASDLTAVDRWLVRPRIVPVAVSQRHEHWGGERRALRGLQLDMTRYAGIRAYQPGDPIRSIHWPATARLGTPVSRRFEPGRRREVVVVLDVQTIEGPSWATSYDEDAVESLCIAAGSLVCRLREDGAAVGLAASGYAGAIRPFAFVPPGSSNEHVGRCLDLLARLGPFPAVPIERVLTSLARQMRPGTSVMLVGARDSVAFMPALRRLSTAGFPVRYVRLGVASTAARNAVALAPEADDRAALRRAARVGVSVARLDAGWPTATAMVVE